AKTIENFFLIRFTSSVFRLSRVGSGSLLLHLLFHFNNLRLVRIKGQRLLNHFNRLIVLGQSCIDIGQSIEDLYAVRFLNSIALKESQGIVVLIEAIIGPAKQP